jgi:hypothetical protein
VNDDFRDLKARLHRLDDQLAAEGPGHLPFAQAVSALKRAVHRGDRSRPPTAELVGLLEKAEQLGKSKAGE